MSRLDEQLDGLAAARAATHPSPTEAQKHAGNYPKGKVQLHGMTITIENPKGSTRSGTDRTGKTWTSLMRHDYGYINGTVGRDKDHLDAFLGPHHESELVHVVDQVSPHSGRFDEHKVVFGARSGAEARDIYLANYAKGWKGLGNITAMPVHEFKAWLQHHDTTRPMSGQRRDPKDTFKRVNEIIEAVLEGARPDAALAGITHTVPHAGGQLHFTLPYALRHSKLHVPVMLDVAKVEQGWRKDRGFHIGAGGTGDAIRGRYERFGEFLKSGTPIEMPEIGATHGGRVVFTNGRHRFAVLRDQGVHELPFMVSREEAPTILQQFGAQSQVHESLGLVKVRQRPFLLDPREQEMDADVYDFGHKRKSDRYFPRHGVEHEFDVIHPQHGAIGTLHVVHTERNKRRLFVPWMEIRSEHAREVTPLSLRDSLMTHFPKARELRGWRITGRKPGLRSYTLPPERTNRRQGELFSETLEEGDVIRVPAAWWKDPKPVQRVAGTAPVYPITKGVHGRTPTPKSSSARRMEKFTPGRAEHMLSQIAADLHGALDTVATNLEKKSTTSRDALLAKWRAKPPVPKGRQYVHGQDHEEWRKTHGPGPDDETDD